METFLEMAKRHRAADMLTQRHFEVEGGQACSIGCFNDDLGHKPGDFEALAKFSGFPVWAHEIQEAVFEGLPLDESREWHVQFAEKCESVSDWPAFYHRVMVVILNVALPHDTSKGQVVQRVIDLHERGPGVGADEWAAARAAARAAWDASRAAQDAASYAARAAARAAAGAAAGDDAADDAWRSMRDGFLNANGGAA